MNKISLLTLLFLGYFITGCANNTPQVDTDNDGVPNYIDLCKNTSRLAFVDKYGCAIDSDKDGVADIYDKCPHTPFLKIVNSQGCPKR